MTSTIDRLESEVRSYCRSFPTVFTKAEGALIHDQSGQCYLDFFAGAGALNYGHNEPHLKQSLIEYLSSSGITHGLDMATEAKTAFMDTFERTILAPRGLDYKMMFPGPTGTNSVEAAIKIARKVTQRSDIIAFTNAFHGMTLGSLALTGNAKKRRGAGITLNNVSRMPFDRYLGAGSNTIDYIEAFLDDPSSGVDAPAAFIVETTQGEGGINVASTEWLLALQRLARRHGSLLIFDDIQVGCGRTGPFFSFENRGLRPDIVCLSKSLSGYGLPLALTLLRPELDQWKPGEHNGTFRGNNLAFVTATAALERFWSNDRLTKAVASKSRYVRERLTSLGSRVDAEPRGVGLIQGLAFQNHQDANDAARQAFRRGLLIETSGAHDEVLKLLPSLTIEQRQLEQGLDIIEESVLVAHRTNRSAAQRRGGAGRPSRVDREVHA